MPVYFVESTTAADEPMFVISVAARLVEMHPQTLRYYERAGLVKPKRSRGSIRLYSQHDIERLRKIARLVDDLGVNLAGVEVILNLTEKVQALQQLLQDHQIALPQTSDANDLSETFTTAPRTAPTKIQVRRPRTKNKETETLKPKRSIRNGRNIDGTNGTR
jgi:MerR family transcriptional regulator/heat shock protein HspR